MDKLNIVLDKIEKLCNPRSIFLYGSRSRSDFTEDSDYEIGVLISETNYIGRSIIERKINEKNFSIYPFKYKDFIEGKIDAPFQKNIYLYELVGAGKTLRGDSVIEKMDLPSITIIDLMQRIRFDIGFALGAIMSNRNGDVKTASVEFYKSCLFGLRVLEIFELRKFAFTYQDIYSFSKELDLGKYENLIFNAYSVRINGRKFEDKDLFKNISFLNEFIETKIVEYFNKNGNEKIIQ